MHLDVFVTVMYFKLVVVVMYVKRKRIFFSDLQRVREGRLIIWRHGLVLILFNDFSTWLRNQMYVPYNPPECVIVLVWAAYCGQAGFTPYQRCRLVGVMKLSFWDSTLAIGFISFSAYVEIERVLWHEWSLPPIPGGYHQ